MTKRTVTIYAEWCGHEIELHVDVCIWPAEPMTWDHPGAPGEIEICAVRLTGGTEVELLVDAELEWLEQRVEELLSDEEPDHG